LARPLDPDQPLHAVPLARPNEAEPIFQLHDKEDQSRQEGYACRVMETDVLPAVVTDTRNSNARQYSSARHVLLFDATVRLRTAVARSAIASMILMV
jgi:hypothetical protein